MIISFPFGAVQAVSFHPSQLMEMSESAIQFIRAEAANPLAALLARNRIPLIHQQEAVRQLAAGLGIAYPERVDEAQIERMASAIQAEVEKSQELSLKILGKAIFRELTSNGYAPKSIAGMATYLLSLVVSEKST